MKIKFLERLLKYDHQQRCTAKEAMEDPYFGKLSPSFLIVLYKTKQILRSSYNNDASLDSVPEKNVVFLSKELS
jgi:serine/threonine protein kinase